MRKISAIVLRGEPEIKLPSDTVPVTVNFDRRKPPIGRAQLRRDTNGDVIADVELFGPIEGTPCAAIYRGEIPEVSICASGNIDHTIPPIKVE